jgi:hypothetical protein
VRNQRDRIPHSPPGFEFSDEQIRAAQLNVARGAKNVEDLALLLDVLGLYPKDEQKDTKVVKKTTVERKKDERKAEWEREIEWLLKKGR